MALDTRSVIARLLQRDNLGEDTRDIGRGKEDGAQTKTLGGASSARAIDQESTVGDGRVESAGSS